MFSKVQVAEDSADVEDSRCLCRAAEVLSCLAVHCLQRVRTKKSLEPTPRRLQWLLHLHFS